MQASRQLAIAKGVSEIGNSLRYIALPLGILAIRNSPKNLAFAEVLETLGFITSGILTTFFIDRVPKIKALVFADILSLVSTLGIAYALQIQSLPLILVFAFCMTFIDTFYQSTIGAVTADISESKDKSQRAVIQGFSNLQLYILLGALSGSLFGSFLIAHVSPSILILLDATTFLLSSIWIFKIVLRFAPTLSHRAYEKGLKLSQYLKESYDELATALVYLKLKKRILYYALGQSFVGFAYGLSSAASVSHFKITLRFTNRMVGLYQVSNRAFGFLGAIVRVRSKLSPRIVLIGGLILMFLGYLGMGTFHSIVAAAAFGVQQFGNSLVTPTNRALILSETESHLRGRVENLRGLLIDAGVLSGNLITLALLSLTSTRFPFLIAAAGLGFAVYFNERAFDPETDNTP